MLAAWSNRPLTRVLVGERFARHFTRSRGNSLGVARVCVGTPEVLSTLADAEDATSKLVIVGIDELVSA